MAKILFWVALFFEILGLASVCVASFNEKLEGNHWKVFLAYQSIPLLLLVAAVVAKHIF